MRMNIVICTNKSWNVRNAEEFAEAHKTHQVHIWTKKEELTREKLETIGPDFVFFPHWSYLIPAEIYSAYPCVVFHMTDLPFGRGGSPLQNLIVRGLERTKISAIRVDGGIDTGPVYMKYPLELDGSAEEILKRASNIVFHRMIPEMMEKRPEAVPQSGQVVTFKRRKPEDGRLTADMDMKTLYDYIRMLDGEGYPKAFMDFQGCRMEFRGAERKDGVIQAQITIREEKDDEENTGYCGASGR